MTEPSFDSTPEFQHFSEVMRGVLAVPKKRIDELVDFPICDAGLIQDTANQFRCYQSQREIYQLIFADRITLEHKITSLEYVIPVQGVTAGIVPFALPTFHPAANTPLPETALAAR